eukprot:TRINITY_DN849_c0_g8_i1.p1 TRINITY_DN849_c0_g8~~TRINITY_DN849_c0_g8_i1.p1  ORF type:complete len:516 (+),score=77.36 TRINITY_DN849_c0_g8_i1:74-1621(+)
MESGQETVEVSNPREIPSLHTQCLKSLKRARDMFLSNHFLRVEDDVDSQRMKLVVKIQLEYEAVKDMAPPVATNTTNSFVAPAPIASPSPVTSATLQEAKDTPTFAGAHPYPATPGTKLREETAATVAPIAENAFENMLQSLPKPASQVEQSKISHGLIEYRQPPPSADKTRGPTSNALARRSVVDVVKPEWHYPWKLMRVISAHLGWVRSVTVDPTNDWFATGSADRTIKIWDLASGTLKLTLTGHISPVRGLAVSDRHPYLFSAGEDKQVKCWDLEQNKVIRHYHGHLSGIYCLDIHPTLDLLFTGGRDSVVRVWDIRTKTQVHVLGGHQNTVASVKTQATDPQVVTGSMDSTIRLWDLAAGKAMTTLTNHKKSVRSVCIHPTEYTFGSASADNVKKWKLPEGQFMSNLTGHNAIINTMAINQEGVLFTGADNGSMAFWDWRSGYKYQDTQTTPQPGSLDSEAGIFCSTFDRSGSRLITGEGDKSIKIWKEDTTATPESHPIKWKPSIPQKNY